MWEDNTILFFILPCVKSLQNLRKGGLLEVGSVSLSKAHFYEKCS